MHRVSILLWVVVSAFLTQAEMFKDGDTVVFLGDSITHVGLYEYNLYDYYLTRFPKAKIRFVNSGVGGDTAGGCMRRFKDDVIDKKPTHVCVFFGMNDIGYWNYGTNRTPAQIQLGERSLAAYRRNMTNLVAQIALKAGNPKVVFVTPSPYDDRAVIPGDSRKNAFGSRDALGVCAGIVREICAENKGELVDLYTPMTSFNRMKQKTDTSFTLIGKDRVHPGEAGALFMAWRFLMAQGADALVSDITIDTTIGKCVKSLNADVSAVKKGADGNLSFTVQEHALPFPVAGVVRKLASELSIDECLNQEIFTVTGLAEGSYELKIDGETVATHTAKEWSDGINLAVNKNTPQYKQAMEVHNLNRQRRLIEMKIRNWATERWFLIPHVKNIDDEVEVKAFSAKLKAAGRRGYYEDNLDTYLKEWPNREAQYEMLEKATRELFELRVPKQREYVLTKVKF